MEKGEIYDDFDEEGRKYKLIVTDVKELPDGTRITRARSMPVGVAKLECGHFTPVFIYEAEQAEKLRCYRCKELKKPLELKWKWLE